MSETTYPEHKEEEEIFPVFIFSRKVTQGRLPVKRGFMDDFNIYEIDFAPDSPGTDEQKKFFRAAVADFLPDDLLRKTFRSSGLDDTGHSGRAHAESIADRAIALLSNAEFQREVIATYKEILALRSKVDSKLSGRK